MDVLKSKLGPCQALFLAGRFPAPGRGRQIEQLPSHPLFYFVYDPTLDQGFIVLKSEIMERAIDIIGTLVLLKVSVSVKRTKLRDKFGT